MVGLGRGCKNLAPAVRASKVPASTAVWARAEKATGGTASRRTAVRPGGAGALQAFETYGAMATVMRSLRGGGSRGMKP
jgi:hypothetical protein